ncbi:hypothetical protein AB870_24740 (plasmid) [Pandoraea faecigallinarum]|uniref:Uncharacterized protein n=1 Tax=Pandoraea faecigallinarum TaxID=656179 RepID=A0A0H3X098_9BURK|nr:hypothetical protein [Pandoraea faecigallinarum]AKM33392.1 hypothetical protein AB870_24740 [Pandoraea faecigallinarum]
MPNAISSAHAVSVAQPVDKHANLATVEGAVSLCRRVLEVMAKLQDFHNVKVLDTANRLEKDAERANASKSKANELDAIIATLKEPGKTAALPGSVEKYMEDFGILVRAAPITPAAPSATPAPAASAGPADDAFLQGLKGPASAAPAAGATALAPAPASGGTSLREYLVEIKQDKGPHQLTLAQFGMIKSALDADSQKWGDLNAKNMMFLQNYLQQSNTLMTAQSNTANATNDMNKSIVANIR